MHEVKVPLHDGWMHVKRLSVAQKTTPDMHSELNAPVLEVSLH